MVLVGCTDKFRSVEIVHNDLNRIDFSYLAEFFRLMGVFVCENILVEPQEKTEAEKSTKYSAHIYVGKKTLGDNEKGIYAKAIVWEDVEAEYEKRIKSLPAETIFLYDDATENLSLLKKQDISFADMLFRLKQDYQKSILKSLMKRVLGSIYDSADANRITSGQLEKLIDVFVDNELWFHSLNLQYYPKKSSNFEDKAMETFQKTYTDAKEAFLNAQKEIKTAAENRQKDSAQFIYDYAQLWCEVKTNQACYGNGEILYFLIERLSGRCEELCRKYPDFSNARVLLGLCYEHSKSKANEALLAYDSALQDIGEECFASSVYYWVGKRYEGYNDKETETKRSYELANKCKCKFRSCFKIAICAKKDKAYLKSVKWFEFILHKLNIKEKMDIVDPLEIEYLFKAYTQLGHIYYMEGEYDTAIDKAKKAIEIWKKYIEQANREGQKDYFKIFYGEEKGEDYRSILKGRLVISSAQDIIKNCEFLMGKS